MKIDSIQIESLASLRGEQEAIDLVAGDLADAGLVAITGPTGAGKTTILDAVCLALYDRTPRLASASDAQELLTRGAGEGGAVVDLTLDDGRRWRVEWRVHRAHQRPDGALQPSRRRVLDAVTGEVVAEGKRDVEALVEKALGLTFDQFTGVILLAQGEFAKFLSAKDAERSALLERLTGTEIYTRLSQAAFERHKELRDRLKLDSERLETLVPLEAAVRRAKEQELDDLEPTLARLEAQLQAVDARLAWLATRVRLDTRAEESAGRLAEADRALADAADDRERLAAGEKASALAGPLQALDAARASAEEAERARDAAREAAGRSAEALGDALRALAGSLQHLDRAVEIAEEEAEAVADFAEVSADEVASLRQARRDLDAARRRLDERVEAAKAARAQIDERRRDEAEAEKALAEAAERRTALDERLAELAERRREATGGESPARLAERRLYYEHAAEVWTALESLDAESKADALEGARVETRGAAADAEASRRLVESARRELEQHEEVLRLALVGAELSEHRKHLVAGEPCPLCGAVDHPLVGEDGRAALRGAKTRKEALRRELDRAEASLAEAETVLRRAEQAVERAEDELTRTRRAIQEQGARWTELTFQLADLPHEIEETSVEALRASCDEAARRLEAAEALDEEEAGLRREATAAAEAATLAERRRDLARERLAEAGRRAEERAEAERAAREAHDALRASAFEDLRGFAEIPAVAEAIPPRLDESPVLDSVLDLASAIERVESILVDGRRRHAEAVERRRRLESLDGRYGERARAHLAEAADRPADPAADREPVENLDAESLEQRLRDAVLQADEAGERSRRDRQAFEHATEALEKAVRRREATEADFEAALDASTFAAEADLRAALLDPDALDALRRRLEALRLDVERRRAEHERSLADLEEHRESAASLGIDLSTLEVDALRESLEERAHGLRARSSEVTERKNLLQVEIRQDDLRREERAKLEEAVADLRASRDRAARLAQLIGQSDGGKFRRFAQQLNLDQLLALANRRLERLEPRYALDRLENTLDLEVVDRDMADERRPVSTLSGGESFLVSLSLALALADLRRGRLELGTLFLDEGFGSLDQDTLDTALSTLEQLQADQSTQILVISHVGALQERIPHRIEVRKRGGGRSRLRVRVGD